MPKFLKLIVLLLIGQTAMAQPKIPTDSLVFTEFQSTVMAEKRRIIVHLPLNYFKETDKKYPVMYVLDGTSQDQHTSDKISVLAAANLMPECIVVGILNSKGNRNRDQTPPFMQTETEDSKSPFGEAGLFLSFIEKELIPKIEQSYRSNGYRTLSGHSRGGLFVLYSLLEKPDLFNARFCYSTPVWRFSDSMTNKIADFAKAKNPIKKSFLFLSAGANETENIVGGFNRLNVVLVTHKIKNLKLFAYLTPLADHQQNPLFATSRAMAEWGAYYLAQSTK
jgi:predicted alpha/beta superfamily hydrolase